MNSIGADRNGNIAARIDEEFSSQFSVLSSQLGHHVASERFQIAGGEIFFSQLDEVHPGVSRFGDFAEQVAAARGFVAGEL